MSSIRSPRTASSPARSALWLVVFLALVVIAAPPAWLWIKSFNWGSFPDYLAGLGAVAALIWARKAAKAAKAANERQDKQLQILIDDKQEQAEEKKREQANSIAAWTETALTPNSPAEGEPACQIRNASNLPIYRCFIAVYEPQSERGPDQLIEALDLGTVPPASAPRMAYIGKDRMQLRTRLAGQLEVEIIFADALGVHWFRDRFGELVEIDREEHHILATRYGVQREGP